MEILAIFNRLQLAMEGDFLQLDLFNALLDGEESFAADGCLLDEIKEFI